jgi:hypothetical protein
MIISVCGENPFVFNTDHLVMAEYCDKENVYRLTFEAGDEKIVRTASKQVFLDIVECINKVTR